MNRNIKTIAVLNVCDSARTDKLTGRYGGLQYKNEYQLEAYASLDEALSSMDEEFLSCINEIVFTNCTILKSKVLIDPAEDDGFEVWVDYTNDGDTIYSTRYSLSIINLVM